MSYSRPIKSKRPKAKRLAAVGLHRMVSCLENVLRAGELCSNVCFNLSQRDSITEADKLSMREAYVRWDSFRREAWRGLKKLKAAND